MKPRKLALLFALLLGLAPLATAQRSSYRSSHRAGVTVQAKLGHLGINLGFGRRPSISYRHPSRYVSSAPCPPTRVWVEGYYRTDYKKVWISEYQDKRWVAPRYETRVDSCGNSYSVLVRNGYWTLVTIPGHFENRPVKSWVPGRYEYRR